ncbi:Peroxidase 11, partial [Asimina triloba]
AVKFHRAVYHGTALEEEIIRAEMGCAVFSDPRNAATILRLHFHDCFVQVSNKGCDGSVLLDDTITLQGEKAVRTNVNSLKGFDLVDRIKNKLESECPGVVSCADLLAIAARDAVLLVGGPYWDVPVGRKDSRSASNELANANLPTADEGLATQITKFLSQDMSVTDLALTNNEFVHNAGAHTIGMARCENFRNRIYGDFPLTAQPSPLVDARLDSLKSVCSATGSNDDDHIAAMDYVTPYLFDNSFYHTLLRGEGLLNSDQEMYSSKLGLQTRELVQKYAADLIAFFQQFSDSMVKLGNLTGAGGYAAGEVRKNCRYINSNSNPITI